MTRVLLVDDHEIVRCGLVDLLDAEPDLEVVGHSAGVAGTLEKVTALRPDVVLLDVVLPDGSGIDLCREIRSTGGRARCLILTAYDDDRASIAAVLAGAAGYLLKSESGEAIVASVRAVAHGRLTLSPVAVQRVVSHLGSGDEPTAADLTPRERQILDLVAEGLTNSQIADRMGLSHKTVRNHMSAVLSKLGVERRTQAAMVGARLAGGRAAAPLRPAP